MTVEEFIKRIYIEAQKGWEEFRILPSLTLAQGIIESNKGNSELVVKANALFGIKANSDWTGRVYSKDTGECYDGVNYVSVNAVFRAYNTWEDSIRDHGKYLAERKLPNGELRYQKVIGETDYKKACAYVKEAGYATSPTYTQTLIDCIERYNLTQYDNVVNEKEGNQMVIGVNCGHTLSGAGSGAVGMISESEHTRKVGYALMEKLKENGVTVVDCTIDSTASQNAALAAITAQANRQDLDWFVSIHFNAGGGQGVECYTYKGRQYEDAVEICKNISSLGFNNRGVKNGTGLYVINKTKAKAILVEVCFVDSADANKYLGIGAEAIAEQIAKALVDTIHNNIEETTSGGQWVQDSVGWWWKNPDGTYPAAKWLEINGKWYYFKSDGYIVTNSWYTVGGTWYYFNESGHMMTGWIQLGGSWYYLADNGAMQTGLIEVNGKKYYLKEDGSMAYTDASGALV